MEEAGSEECFCIVGNQMIVSANGLDKNVLQVYLTKINDSIVEMFFVCPEKNKRLIQQIAPDSLAVRTNKKRSYLHPILSVESLMDRLNFYK